MLNNQVVLITGGVGLLGSSFSKAIVQNGGKVIIGDILRNKGIDLQSELGIDNAIFIEVDSTNPASIDEIISSGKKHFGKIDSAIHCAYPRSKQWGTKFEDLEVEGLKDDLFNQLGGAIIFSQRMINFFKQQGYGNLLHISSIQGVTSPKFEHYEGTSMVSPIEYSAIKSGITSITKYLAKYCKGNDIRVNCISPGGILDGQSEIFLKKYNASCSSKGMLDPSDLDGTIVYLLSHMSKHLNGQNIVVDDGWML